MPRSEPGDLVDLLARRDCGPAEFEEVRQYLNAHRDSELLNRADFSEWIMAHKNAINKWLDQKEDQNDRSL